MVDLLAALVFAATVRPGAAVEGVNQFPTRVLYARGGVTEAAAGGAANEGKSVTLAWQPGGEQPVVAYDYGGRTVGGYAVFRVTGFKPQGKNAEGEAVGYPVLRLAYATHPEGLRPTGDFTRRCCISYLGPTFDNPVLPANVNRFETYTINRTGTFVAPLLQGQERYLRVQLDTPGTEVSVDGFEIRNTGVYSRERPVGRFHCSDPRIDRVWDMSAWTCQLASFPNHDAWRVVAGRLLPRKLERGSEAGFCSTASWDGDGSWRATFELCANPHFPSAFALMLRAHDAENGVVVAVRQPGYVQIVRRADGANAVLRQKVLDRAIVDGEVHVLEARVAGRNVAAYVDGVKITEVDDLSLDLGGRFGCYVEKEWWPVVRDFTVTDANGRTLFSDDFSGADDEGRLSGWDYSRSFKFISDGAKRDRLVWIGDLWWAERTCFYAYAPDWPYFRESLKLLAFNQTPEGYVWASPYAETQVSPKSGEYGHFPSDEFSTWLAPITWDYYLHTADDATMQTLYPAVRRQLAYVTSHCRAEDGLFIQRLETSSNVTSMPPKDPRTRVYMQLLLWRAYVDGAKLARAFNHSDDAARWEALATRLAATIRRLFWDPQRKIFVSVLGGKNAGSVEASMALALEFATPDEALALAPKIAFNGTTKMHLLGMRGKFIQGFDEAAFNMLEGGSWFRLADPQWEGAQCCTECGYLVRDSFWDESHPDMTVGGPIISYLLGVEPVEPGFRRFRFAPHIVSRLKFAEGEVPTPHGFVRARWERVGDRVQAKLEVPAGTVAEIAFSRASGVTVDGRPYAAETVLKPGRHVIEAAGMDAKAFEDKSLLSGSAVDAGEHWFVSPPMAWNRDSNPAVEPVHTIDFGAVRNVLEVEIMAGAKDTFPAEIGIEVSTDGVEWKLQRELTGLVYPESGKAFTVDLRTAGSSLAARFVRLRCRRVPGHREPPEGVTYYTARLGRIRVLYTVQ